LLRRTGVIDKGMKKGKVFKLYTKPNVVLYDYDLQEVKYKDVLDDGTVVYELKGVWSEKVNAYVTRPYYAVEYINGDKFVRYVEKVVCISDKAYNVKGSYACRGGRIVSKLAMWVLDKRFRELCELL
jgi:hypothetical protein